MSSWFSLNIQGYNDIENSGLCRRKKNLTSLCFQYIIQKAPCPPYLGSEAKSTEMNSSDRFTCENTNATATKEMAMR